MSRSRKTRVIVEGAVVSPHKRVHEALSLLRAVPNVERWVLSASFYEPPYIDCELLLKMVPRSRISQVYSSADYLVKLSKSEGFGLSPLEMMACGGLPIVEDFGGQRDYLKDGENGFLLPERSRAAMKDVFERATDDRLVRSMRSNAVDTARAFAWGPQGEHLLDAIAGADVLNSGSAVHSVSMGGEVVKPKGFASIELKRQSPITAVRLRGWLAKRGGGDAEGFKIGAKGGSLLQVKAHVVRADVREARHVDGTYGFDVLFFLPSGSSDDIETRLLDKDTELVVDELRSYHVYPVSGYPDSIEAKFDAYAGAVLATSAGGEYDFPELYGTHLRFINSSIRHCRKLGGELRLLLQKHDAEEPPISVAAFYGQP